MNRSLRCCLISFLVACLALTIIRESFDFVGRLWLCILVNFIHIIAVIFGIFGASQLRPSYVILLCVWMPFWWGWHAFLICYFLNIGPLNRQSGLLSFAQGGPNFWAKSLHCLDIVDTSIGVDTPSSRNSVRNVRGEEFHTNPPAILRQSTLSSDTTDTNCAFNIDYGYIEIAQSGAQLLVCVISWFLAIAFLYTFSGKLGRNYVRRSTEPRVTMELSEPHTSINGANMYGTALNGGGPSKRGGGSGDSFSRGNGGRDYSRSLFPDTNHTGYLNASMEDDRIPETSLGLAHRYADGKIPPSIGSNKDVRQPGPDLPHLSSRTASSANVRDSRSSERERSSRSDRRSHRRKSSASSGRIRSKLDSDTSATANQSLNIDTFDTSPRRLDGRPRVGSNVSGQLSTDADPVNKSNGHHSGVVSVDSNNNNMERNSRSKKRRHSYHGRHKRRGEDRGGTSNDNVIDGPASNRPGFSSTGSSSTGVFTSSMRRTKKSTTRNSARQKPTIEHPHMAADVRHAAQVCLLPSPGRDRRPLENRRSRSRSTSVSRSSRHSDVISDARGSIVNVANRNSLHDTRAASDSSSYQSAAYAGSVVGTGVGLVPPVATLSPGSVDDSSIQIGDSATNIAAQVGNKEYRDSNPTLNRSGPRLPTSSAIRAILDSQRGGAGSNSRGAMNKVPELKHKQITSIQDLLVDDVGSFPSFYNSQQSLSKGPVTPKSSFSSYVSAATQPLDQREPPGMMAGQSITSMVSSSATTVSLPPPLANDDDGVSSHSEAKTPKPSDMNSQKTPVQQQKFFPPPAVSANPSGQQSSQNPAFITIDMDSDNTLIRYNQDLDNNRKFSANKPNEQVDQSQNVYFAPERISRGPILSDATSVLANNNGSNNSLLKNNYTYDHPSDRQTSAANTPGRFLREIVPQLPSFRNNAVPAAGQISHPHDPTQPYQSNRMPYQAHIGSHGAVSPQSSLSDGRSAKVVSDPDDRISYDSGVLSSNQSSTKHNPYSRHPAPLLTQNQTNMCPPSSIVSSASGMDSVKASLRDPTVPHPTSRESSDVTDRQSMVSSSSSDFPPPPGDFMIYGGQRGRAAFEDVLKAPLTSQAINRVEADESTLTFNQTLTVPPSDASMLKSHHLEPSPVYGNQSEFGIYLQQKGSNSQLSSQSTSPSRSPMGTRRHPRPRMPAPPPPAL